MSLDHRTDRPNIKLNVGGSLSMEDKKLIRESHNILFNQMQIEKKGVEFLIEFFRAYPSHQQYFKAFKGLQVEELQTLPYTRNHGSSVIHKLGRIVDTMDEPDEMKAILLELLEIHIPRTVKVAEMKDIMMMFVLFIKEKIGAKFTARHEESWRKLVLQIQNAMEELEVNYRIPATRDPLTNDEDECLEVGSSVA